MKREKKVIVRYSDEEITKIKTCAEENGMPVSSYIRFVTLKNKNNE